MSNKNAVFRSFGCPNCDTFLTGAPIWKRHLIKCSERVIYFYSRIVYQKRQTLFDKLDSFSNNYTNEQQLFKHFAIVDFEPMCVQWETFRNTNTTNWIGKHAPISVSISSNIVTEPILLCSSDLHHLIASFSGSLKSTVSQSKTKREFLFPDIETTIKTKLGSILEALAERHSRRERVRRFDMEKMTVGKISKSTRTLQRQ